jgi:hypothetical protein
MALPSSGVISLNDVNVELGLSATATISLNDAAVRTLAGISSGTISMSDLYGKSAAAASLFSAATLSPSGPAILDTPYEQYYFYIHPSAPQTHPQIEKWPSTVEAGAFPNDQLAPANQYGAAWIPSTQLHPDLAMAHGSWNQINGWVNLPSFMSQNTTRGQDSIGGMPNTNKENLKKYYLHNYKTSGYQAGQTQYGNDFIVSPSIQLPAQRNQLRNSNQGRMTQGPGSVDTIFGVQYSPACRWGLDRLDWYAQTKQFWTINNVVTETLQQKIQNTFNSQSQLSSGQSKLETWMGLIQAQIARDGSMITGYVGSSQSTGAVNKSALKSIYPHVPQMYDAQKRAYFSSIFDSQSNSAQGGLSNVSNNVYFGTQAITKFYQDFPQITGTATSRLGGPSASQEGHLNVAWFEDSDQYAFPDYSNYNWSQPNDSQHPGLPFYQTWTSSYLPQNPHVAGLWAQQNTDVYKYQEWEGLGTAGYQSNMRVFPNPLRPDQSVSAIATLFQQKSVLEQLGWPSSDAQGMYQQAIPEPTWLVQDPAYIQGGDDSWIMRTHNKEVVNGLTFGMGMIICEKQNLLNFAEFRTCGFRDTLEQASAKYINRVSNNGYKMPLLTPDGSGGFVKSMKYRTQYSPPSYNPYNQAVSPASFLTYGHIIFENKHLFVNINMPVAPASFPFAKTASLNLFDKLTNLVGEGPSPTNWSQVAPMMPWNVSNSTQQPWVSPFTQQGLSVQTRFTEFTQSGVAHASSTPGQILNFTGPTKRLSFKFGHIANYFVSPIMDFTINPAAGFPS